MKPTSEQTYELSTITLHPGWETLTKVAGQAPEELALIIARRIMRDDVPTPEEIAYFRGYRNGVRETLAAPMVALRKLKRLADGESQTEE